MAKHFRLLFGDITTSECETIVNAWNRNFIPYWLLLPQGVAGAIRRAAGPVPFREVGRYGVLPLGGAVVTGGGRLPAKHIIHVAALHAYWRSSLRAVELGAASAFRVARELETTSLALPLLGSGTGGVRPEDSLAAIRAAWEAAPSPPAETHVYVFDADSYERLVLGDDWQRGCAALGEGRFWDAHEAWEEIWRRLPESSGRETLQCLIQLAAACHKTVQDGDVGAMQRGLAALIGSSRAHLAAASHAGSPSVGVDADEVERALRELEELHALWTRGAETSEVRTQVWATAARLLESLANAGLAVAVG